ISPFAQKAWVIVLAEAVGLDAGPDENAEGYCALRGHAHCGAKKKSKEDKFQFHNLLLNWKQLIQAAVLANRSFRRARMWGKRQRLSQRSSRLVRRRLPWGELFTRPQWRPWRERSARRRRRQLEELVGLSLMGGGSRRHFALWRRWRSRLITQ